MVVVELSERHIAGEAQQSPDCACRVTVVHGERGHFARLAVLHTFRSAADSAHPVLLSEQNVVVVKTDAVLVPKIVVTYPVRVSVPILFCNPLVRIGVTFPPRRLLFVVTNKAATKQTIGSIGTFREFAAMLTTFAFRANFHYQADKSFVKGRRNVIDRTIPCGM